MDFTTNLEQAMKHLSTTGAFLTAKSEDGVNTMTISWGFVGFFWHKPLFIAGVRPQRYTMKILEKADSFTVSIPFGTLKEALTICGTKSGADIDKSQIVQFVDAKSVNSPIVAGCNHYYECAIAHVDTLTESALKPEILKFYEKDYHKLFFGEIINCY